MNVKLTNGQSTGKLWDNDCVSSCSDLLVHLEVPLNTVCGPVVFDPNNDYVFCFIDSQSQLWCIDMTKNYYKTILISTDSVSQSAIAFLGSASVLIAYGKSLRLIDIEKTEVNERFIQGNHQQNIEKIIVNNKHVLTKSTDVVSVWARPDLSLQFSVRKVGVVDVALTDSGLCVLAEFRGLSLYANGTLKSVLDLRAAGIEHPVIKLVATGEKISFITSENKGDIYTLSNSFTRHLKRVKLPQREMLTALERGGSECIICCDKCSCISVLCLVNMKIIYRIQIDQLPSFPVLSLSSGSFFAVSCENRINIFNNKGYKIEGPSSIKPIINQERGNVITRRACSFLQKYENWGESDSLEKAVELLEQQREKKDSYVIFSKFLSCYGSYPDRLRAHIWRSLLHVQKKDVLQPQFNELIAKGVHPAVKGYSFIFDLLSEVDGTRFCSLLSLIFRHLPGFQGCEALPGLLFSFFQILGNDLQNVFEIFITFAHNWARDLLSCDSENHFKFLSVMRDVLFAVCPKAVLHFEKHNISTAYYILIPLRVALSEILSAEQWKKVMDHVLTNSPYWFFLFYICWIRNARFSLLSKKTVTSIKRFLCQPCLSVNIDKTIYETYNICSKFSSSSIAKSYEEIITIRNSYADLLVT